MLFWLFVIIMAVGIVFVVISDLVYKHTRKYWSAIDTIGRWTAGISAVVIVIMLLVLGYMHINIDAQVEGDKERYTALQYKATSGACRDEFGLLSKEVIDEIQDWNEDVRYYQEAQDDFWVGIFYPDVFNQFKTIDYESYNAGN